MQDLKVAAVQMNSIRGDVKANLETIEKFTKQANQKRVDIICFPECSVIGYFTPPITKTWLTKENKFFWRKLFNLAQSVPGPITERLLELSKQNNITILAGLIEKGKSNVIYNTHVVASPEGLLGKYRKIHMPWGDYPSCVSGQKIPVFRHPKCTFGIAICYDSMFPELTRILALKGAEIIFVPYACICEKWKNEIILKKQINDNRTALLKYLTARAFDNRAYVVACDQIGYNYNEADPSLGGSYCPGNCLILGPEGDIIAETVSQTEDMIIAVLERNMIEEARSSFHFTLRLRKPELYEYLTKKE